MRNSTKIKKSNENSATRKNSFHLHIRAQSNTIKCTICTYMYVYRHLYCTISPQQFIMFETISPTIFAPSPIVSTSIIPFSTNLIFSKMGRWLHCRRLSSSSMVDCHLPSGGDGCRCCSCRSHSACSC